MGHGPDGRLTNERRRVRESVESRSEARPAHPSRSQHHLFANPRITIVHVSVEQRQSFHVDIRCHHAGCLGANRSTGKGHFNFELAPAPPLPDAGAEANGWVSLSRYLPAVDELPIEGRPLAYRLSTLWAKRERKFVRPAPDQVTPPVYKRRLRVFDPGGLFPLKRRKAVYGRLAEVVPQEGDGWAVYQSGLTIPLFACVTLADEEV